MGNLLSLALELPQDTLKQSDRYILLVIDGLNCDSMCTRMSNAIESDF
jgi:hypothetical protein